VRRVLWGLLALLVLLALLAKWVPEAQEGRLELPDLRDRQGIEELKGQQAMTDQWVQ